MEAGRSTAARLCALHDVGLGTAASAERACVWRRSATACVIVVALLPVAVHECAYHVGKSRQRSLFSSFDFNQTV